MALTPGALTLPHRLRWADRFDWMTRAGASTLKAFLDFGAVMTLLLSDNRSFTVLTASAEPLAASPSPRVLDSGFAHHSSAAWYVLESLKLIEV